jgi:hypothetical protein
MTMAGRYIRKGPKRQTYERGVGRELLRAQLDVFAAQSMRQLAASRNVSTAMILSEAVHEYLSARMEITDGDD